ncbi:MAG: thioredoxin-like domain-containing protein [Planctomycetaceae bacterium]
MSFWLGLAATPGRGDDGTEAAAPAKNPYPGLGDAPPIDGGVEWLNTSGEIRLEDLRGKVVILDFWTYCCINCIHVLPDLKFLEQKYPDQLVVIGVHAPKFDNEHSSENIRNAILRYEIEHPVINDARMAVARQFAFNSWPRSWSSTRRASTSAERPARGSANCSTMWSANS